MIFHVPRLLFDQCFTILISFTFGDVLPQSPVNLVMPLRHAGQYYDAEVNLFYNYFRDYDPITGRYVESDSIGLDGGLNTYGHVGGNALHSNDALGLFPNSAQMACARNPALCAEIGLSTPKPLPKPMVPPILLPKNENCNQECNPPAGVKFNKVTHYDKHGRDQDPNAGSHGGMAKTGSPIHWNYSVNHQLPDGRCVIEKHAFDGCGVAP